MRYEVERIGSFELVVQTDQKRTTSLELKSFLDLLKNRYVFLTYTSAIEIETDARNLTPIRHHYTS
jgi:hypothetical protein